MIRHFFWRCAGCKRIAQAFEDRIDAAAGLLTAFPESCYWNYYEWQDGLSGGYGVKNPDELTYDAPLNAFVSMGFQALEQIYAKLGQPEEAAHCRQVWTALNEAMERTFWNGKWYHSFCRISDGQTFHDAQLTQALMICAKPYRLKSRKHCAPIKKRAAASGYAQLQYF